MLPFFYQTRYPYLANWSAYLNEEGTTDLNSPWFSLLDPFTQWQLTLLMFSHFFWKKSHFQLVSLCNVTRSPSKAVWTACVKPEELRTGCKSDPDWAFLHSAPCAAPHSALERCRMLLYKLHIGMDGVKLYTFPLSFKNVNYGAFHNSAPCAPLWVRALLYMLCKCAYSLFALKMSTFGFSYIDPGPSNCAPFCVRAMLLHIVHWDGWCKDVFSFL